MDAAASAAAAAGIDVTSLHPSHPLFDAIRDRYLAATLGPAAHSAVRSVPLALAPSQVGSPPGQQDTMVEEVGKMAQEDVHELYSTEVFSNYQHREIIPGCRIHPGDIVEAGMLASLTLPKPRYPLSDCLPQEMIESGKLSGLQLEGIIYACERHQMVLPSGTRAGFFMGDAAGVGKGRQISGIIFDNFGRGRTKHVWFSISSDLVVDARRDLTDIGCHIKVIEGCKQLDRETRVFGLPAGFQEGVIFSTYATLVSSVQKGNVLNISRQSRLQQLVDWCGGDNFDGCLIFDECHKAKNFVPGKESASSRVAMAVAHIQRLLPKARVLYCSATGVTDVKNMAFMERMGLWGEGAPFKSFDEFIQTVQRKGLGVAEMLAMEMKSSGMYVSRGLSYKQAEFATVEIDLTPEQVKMFDTAAHVWNELRVSMENATERTNSSNKRVWSAFWGAHQRFFKQLCLGMKVPAIVRETQAALDSGQCVVIGLQTTGEASMESEALKSGVPLKGFVSLCREILTRFIEQHFPVVIEGSVSSAGSPIDDWSATAKQMLLAFAKQISLPDSTLDEIIDKLGGPGKVAEMTGRKARIVRHRQGDQPQYEHRDAGDTTGFLESLNVRERNEFMKGSKLVAIISDAASTGISLHADLRAGNQRRRVHLTIELPWSADKAVQQLGRSHRSNQSSGPIYKLMTTNLGGEKRFAASVARRLQSLGALTKGDRRAATGVDLGDFNFDTQYGRMALRLMYNSICQNQTVPGVAPTSVIQGKFENLTGFNEEMLKCLNLMCILEMDAMRNILKVKDTIVNDVSRFLNRILGLSVSRQQMIFNYFSQCLEAQIQNAKKEGNYNEGLVDVQASSVEMHGEAREVFQSVSNGHHPTKHVVLNVDRGMSWDGALQRLADHPGPDNSFYRSRRDMYGNKLYILATLKEGSGHRFMIARPNTGVSSFEEDRTDLMVKYAPISTEDAEKGWCEQYEQSEQRCIHGPRCKGGASCTVGSRCYRIHLLCGGIMRLMSLLETTIARYGARMNLTKAESTLRVVRAQLNSGERVVGIRYPEMLIPLVEQTLQDQKSIEQAQLLMTQTSGASNVALKAGRLEVEPVSDVRPRFVKKALTPPVTIKNFFKPLPNSTKQPQDSCRDIPTPKAQQSGDSPKPTKGDANTSDKMASLETASCGGTRAKQRDPASIQVPQETSSRTTRRGSKRKLCSDTDTDNTGETEATSSTDINDVKDLDLEPNEDCDRTDGTAEGGSTKRKQPSSAAKKGKQLDLLSVFARQKTLREQNQTKKCPICMMIFKPTAFEREINDHIDNCLIV